MRRLKLTPSTVDSRLMAIMSARLRAEPDSWGLEAVISEGVRALYQPIVQLDDGEVVAYEALARGPNGSPLESPGELFAAAHRAGRLPELDLACRVAAVSGAAEGGLRPPAALFINVEPEVLAGDQGHRVAGHGPSELDIFFEVTERALTLRPAQLLAAVERVREAGFGIALDDVGADRRSLALLPLLRPDVVKLDMTLIHNHPSRLSGEIMNGVCAYAEQTGATIVAEGVETDRHLMAARSLGASLAQGWMFGRPAPLPPEPRVQRSPVTLGLSARIPASSPVALVHERRGLKTGRKDVLLSVTRALEAQAMELGEHAVIVSAFQHARNFSSATRARYERLGARAGLAVALGVGMPDPPAPGVRGARLDPGDVLVGEWDVAVIGPHFAGALVARDLGDDSPDRDRRFEFVLTFDRELVTYVAATLIGRLIEPIDPSRLLTA
jgi:EAL domain-containing protein (putative c-di-GMP-specific phosphodiesterase class I)